ncbi:MAG: RdgB/HAM1 family non-canonical purine NTP pyrophosphatase [Candidatus Omnitrophica bacterium]|nr:RdgB/HAM1 family non-canonical purine NTP pyrophosphatase [Candidatus Omnitrophota bacterium]
MRLIVATQNQKKLREIRELLAGFPLQVISLKEWEGKVEEVVEDGKNFWENAVKKTMAVAYQTPEWVLADDSGLEVDALNGAPGIFSARFAGVGAGLKPAPTDEENNQKLLQLLKGVPLEKRTARFRCSVAIAHGKRLLGVVEGVCEGTITLASGGDYGFGYDPLFIPAGYKQTFAELGPEVKHKISHRWQALAKAKDFISEYVEKSPGRSSEAG